ncbi:MAG: hypothetical protein F9Y92_07465 [Thermoplasmatales archaeon]|jgi:hypothetical protein|nr:hypothetical protein [Thermoplasmatales archaeon]
MVKIRKKVLMATVIGAVLIGVVVASFFVIPGLQKGNSPPPSTPPTNTSPYPIQMRVQVTKVITTNTTTGNKTVTGYTIAFTVVNGTLNLPFVINLINTSSNQLVGYINITNETLNNSVILLLTLYPDALGSSNIYQGVVSLYFSEYYQTHQRVLTPNSVLVIQLLAFDMPGHPVYPVNGSVLNYWAIEIISGDGKLMYKYQIHV